MEDILSSRRTFSGFCATMSHRYRTTHPDSARFLSGKTWGAWVFSWMASFQLDFRQIVDPWCKEDPETLACDGTHIGVSVKQLLKHLDKPMTSAEDHETKEFVHKRYK